MKPVVFTLLPDGTGSLLHLPDMAYFDLNTTAVVIWQGLEEGLSEGVIARRLEERFAVDEGTAGEQVAAFVAALAAAGLR